MQIREELKFVLVKGEKGMEDLLVKASKNYDILRSMVPGDKRKEKVNIYMYMPKFVPIIHAFRLKTQRQCMHGRA